jgi:hypothetical protein
MDGWSLVALAPEPGNLLTSCDIGAMLTTNKPYGQATHWQNETTHTSLPRAVLGTPSCTTLFSIHYVFKLQNKNSRQASTRHFCHGTKLDASNSSNDLYWNINTIRIKVSWRNQLMDIRNCIRCRLFLCVTNTLVTKWYTCKLSAEIKYSIFFNGKTTKLSCIKHESTWYKH